MVPCTTCDGTGQTMHRGETHRGYDDPDYMDTCGICGGTRELPASMFAAVEAPVTEVCAECGANIPVSEPSMISESHRESCSLHPSNVV